MESAELISTPIELSDDGLVQKAANWLGSAANLYCRKWRESQLRSLNEESLALYDRYRGVFKRANALLASRGLEEEDLSRVVRAPDLPRIDSSLANENWDAELQARADSTRNFIEQTCQIAERLIDKLEKMDEREDEKTA
ncbi:MAG: hypothetical protein HDQ93_03930 [Desulfovibrio sp.]|nr:hypothetical protein [Desulfovibrio sp.]